MVCITVAWPTDPVNTCIIAASGDSSLDARTFYNILQCVSRKEKDNFIKLCIIIREEFRAQNIRTSSLQRMMIDETAHIQAAILHEIL